MLEYEKEKKILETLSLRVQTMIYEALTIYIYIYTHQVLEAAYELTGHSLWRTDVKQMVTTIYN